MFIVATVNPSPEDTPADVAFEGLVAPLILRFATDTAVYPLALTGTTGTATELLLYVLSDRKMAADGRLSLRHAARYDPARWVSDLDAVEPEGLGYRAVPDLRDQVRRHPHPR